MIIEFKNRDAPKNPGRWYTFTYDNGLRVTFAEYQGTLSEIEELGRQPSREKKREIRMRIHDANGLDRIHATCHTLRRFYCTNLADAGTELDTLRRMIWHSHIDTTVNHYLKADPRKMKGATTAVDDALDL